MLDNSRYDCSSNVCEVEVSDLKMARSLERKIDVTSLETGSVYEEIGETVAE